MTAEQLPSTGWTPGTKPPAATSAPLAPGAVVTLRLGTGSVRVRVLGPAARDDDA